MKRVIILFSLSLIFSLNVFGEKNKFIIDIGPAIPLAKNAYNLLWGADVRYKIAYNDIASLLFGTKLYYGNAKATIEIEGDTRYYFGIQRDKGYVSENKLYGGFSNVTVTYYFFELYMGWAINFAIQEREISMLLALGLFGNDNEYFYGKLIDKDSIESIGHFFSYTYPINIEIMAQAFNIFNRDIYIVFYYTTIIMFYFRPSNFIKIGLGMEI